jgi:hypothetical protein
VKNASPVKNPPPLEPWVLAVAHASPRVAEVSAADRTLRFEDYPLPLSIEAKRRVDAADAHLLAARLGGQAPDRPPIVVAEVITETARDVLASHGIPFLDGMGHALVRLRGLVIATSEARGSLTVTRPPRAETRLSGKSGLVAQVLLLDRGRSWAVGALAERAGVSTGLAHRILTRLEEAGVVEVHGHGPRKVRRLANPAALLDLWAEEDSDPRLRHTSAFVLAMPGEDLSTAISRRLAEVGIEHAITGSAAAARRLPALTNVPVTQVIVTAARSPDEIIEAIDARPAAEGFNVLLTQRGDDIELRFRREIDGVWLAADTRIYVDALRDPRRGREQADAFRAAAFGF